MLHDIHARTVDALPTILKELKARGYRIVHVVPASADRPPTVTTAEAWRPNSRPKLAAPVILIAEVQEPDGDSLMKRSAAELCSLNLPVHKSPAELRAANVRAWPVSYTLTTCRNRRRWIFTPCDDHGGRWLCHWLAA